MEQKEEKGLKISAASFVVAIGILIALMILTYVLTLIIPSEGIPFGSGFYLRYWYLVLPRAVR